MFELDLLSPVKTDYFLICLIEVNPLNYGLSTNQEICLSSLEAKLKIFS